ncbi:serine/threonine-protein kinase 36-like [Dendronephthya gigantea]|uniref:serine/threonine-protein kinase 36-like n=1 Tax=Dendronephthya gigantea TaxID=151771 RepID=UPI0010696518|nr:serine/threonine-protein kinase 36-like [Dendronephthya gigantea]
MKKYNDLQSFRHPSQDPRQISERSLVCENPPRCFLFAQMTVGLGECYERIRNGDGENKEICLQNQSANEEKFSPITGSILAGRYKVIAKVGEGQSSLLFRAEDIFHPKKRHVAIKFLHASYQNLGPQEASCLLHLKKADFLKVANIAHILNVFTVGQHFCMVFEFLSPTPLYKYFQMFPFPSKVEKVNLIRKIAFQVTQCLAVLSSVNIIHADIKPENILFTNGDKNDVKIIDFGNAIYWNHDEMSLYFGSFELQTVFYRAPEVMFGLPFGPQIDMWSLGCVLAELYLGEPLFLATSKDEILEKMQALLGPFPMCPFQSGKYFSNFKKFVGRVKSVPGYSQNVVNILKKLGSTDYIFADFIARLLTFDPGLRLSPLEAVRHPFLAPECALGLLLPPGYWTQESSNSRILLTPSTYPHRPKIDEKIKKLHYSELDFLRVGTRADDGKADKAGRADNVMKVLPFNYQDESSTGNNENTGEVTNGGNTEGESDSAVERDQTDRLYDNDTRIIFGVESTENVDASRPSAKEDTRYSDFNESCSVLHTTEEIRFIPDPPKDHQKQNSGMFVNRNSNEIREMMDRNASGKSYSIVNTTKREQPIPAKKGRKYSTSLKSFVKPGNMKETGSSKSNLREFPSSGDTSSLPKTLNVHLSPNFAKKTAAKKEHINSCDAVNSTANKGSYNLSHEQRDNTFNESCSVKILFTNPSFSKAEAQKRSSKRRRKYILKKKPSRVSKQSGSETESCCSASTDMPEDNINSRTPRMTRSKSPATTPALSPEIKTTSGKSVAEKEIDNSISPARRTTYCCQRKEY